jgi:hypothetical protein
LTVGAPFRTGNAISVDSAGTNNGQLTIRKAASTVAMSFLGWNNTAYISIGNYYQNGAFVHHSDTTSSSLMVFDPLVGVNWYSSSDSTATWNVASNISLWNRNGQWSGPINTDNNVIFKNTSNFYWDNTNSRLGLRQSSPTSTLHLGGSIGFPVSVKTSNYTLTETDYLILGSGTLTLTLPNATTCGGRQYVIKQVASPGTVTVTGTSTNKFEGNFFSTATGPKTITVQNKAMTVMSDSTDWWITSEFDGTF